MLHETNNKEIIVEDTTIDFKSIYKEEYFPQDLFAEIQKANMLIIPECFSIEGCSRYVFPETTQEFLEYAKEKACDEFIPDIAADDTTFNKTELHSAVIGVATFIVTSVVFPIALNIVADFLYDQVRKHHRKDNELSCKLDIIVTDGKENKRISYKGPVDSAEESLKLAVKGIFKSEGKE